MGEKVNLIEVRLYEFLGIKLFKKLILLFESLKHRKNAGKNENYHPKDTSNGTLSRFSGYLIYNAMLHLISLILAIAYFVTTRSFSFENIVVDVVMLFVIFLDIYCVMLQRYTYIRLKQLFQKKKMFRQKKYISLVSNIKDSLRGKNAEDVEEEISFLRDLQTHLLQGEDIVLSANIKSVLSRISALCDNEPKKSKSKKAFDFDATTFMELVDRIPVKTRVITPVQRRVSELQKLMMLKQCDNVLFGVCVVVDDQEIEAYYEKIFYNSTYDDVLEMIGILIDAYGFYQKEMYSYENI